jgi:hypothetical protein
VSVPLPDQVRSLISRFAQRFSVPQMAGPGPADDAFEDQCRAWTKKLGEQLAFAIGPHWGVKSAAAGRPQSKDAIALNEGGRLIGFDTLVGVGTGHPSLNVSQISGEDITGQIFIPVTPTDHLPPSPDPNDVVSLEALRQKVTAQQKRVEDLERKLSEIAAAPKLPRRIALRNVQTGKLLCVDQNLVLALADGTSLDGERTIRGVVHAANRDSHGSFEEFELVVVE